jgi:hypothetical protein
MITFDIKDLYVNVPTDETLEITRAKLKQMNDTQTAEQITELLKIILQQNYFKYQDEIYQPRTGVAMGSPISSTIAEIFLQTIENTQIKHLMDMKHVKFYTRYVDDVLLIYDERYLSKETIYNHISKIHPNSTLNPTFEEDNRVNFLDLQIIRKQNNIEIDIHRKQTTTNTTINYNSNHPQEHKLAAYRHHIRRMNSLPLTQDRKERD